MAANQSQHDFSLEHYREILTAALRQSYKFFPFTENSAQETWAVFLRHDIDNDVGAAHRMAMLEHEMNVRATYLVMIRSANYNAAEGRNVTMLREMKAMGHEVGLHFSLVDHPARSDKKIDLPTLIRHDADLLTAIMGSPVRVFGFHNPEDRNQYQVRVPELINTYAPQYFDDLKYLSESNMRWKEECPCGMFERRAYPKVQLLVHPLSYAAALTSDREVLLHFLRLRLADLLQYNVSQNRVLEKQGVSMEEVIAVLRQ